MGTHLVLPGHLVVGAVACGEAGDDLPDDVALDLVGAAAIVYWRGSARR